MCDFHVKIHDKLPMCIKVATLSHAPKAALSMWFAALIKSKKPDFPYDFYLSLYNYIGWNCKYVKFYMHNFMIVQNCYF